MNALFRSLILIPGVSNLQAAVTFDAFSTSPGNAFVTGPTAVIFQNESIAVQIQTDNQQWQIDDIDIKWGAALGFGTSPTAIEIVTAGSPYGGGATTSTPMIGANTSPSNTTVNYTPGSPLTLGPLTDFWVYLHVPTGDGDYAVTTTPNSQATGPWAIQEVQALQNGIVIGSLTNTPQIVINATAIPEPSTTLLPFMALGLTVMRRKR